MTGAKQVQTKPWGVDMPPQGMPQGGQAGQGQPENNPEQGQPENKSEAGQPEQSENAEQPKP